MADMAANHAMDEMASMQFELPTPRHLATKIQDLLLNDAGHWYDEQLATGGDSQ